MKKTKMGIVLLMLCLLMTALAACGKSDDTAKEDTQAEALDVEDDTSEDQQTLVGVVTDATMNTLTVKTQAGDEYTFSTMDAELVYKNGMELGNWVSVTYTGELNGTDTSGVTVVKVVDDADNDDTTTAAIQTEQKKTEIKEEHKTMYATIAVHVRASYTTSSKILGTLAFAEAIDITGTASHGWYRVDYNGQEGYVYGKYLSDTQPQAQTSQVGPNTDTTATDGEGKVVTGTVVDATMNNLTVTIDGQQYNLYVGEAEHQYKHGIAAGNQVIITYKGELANNPQVLAVTDDDAN